MMRVGSLYSGAGGFDLGFYQAGFSSEWAVDADEHAIASLVENTGAEGEVVRLGTDSTWTPPSEVDVLIGGPPCQGFSVAGNRRVDDPRSEHVFRFLEVAEALQPCAFVMENVPALACAPRWRSVFQALVRRAGAAGFSVDLWLLEASDFGVAQARRRMFLIGWIPERCARQPERPLPMGTTLTVRSAFENLPPHGVMGNDTGSGAAVVAATNPVLRRSEFAGMLFNGQGRPINLEGLSPTLPATMGGNRSPIVDQRWLDHPEAGPWVTSYHHHLRLGGKPLNKIPEFMRRLTIQEAALLQGFPLSWRFQGPISSQFSQVGNAVPVPLACAVAREIADAILGNPLHGGSPTAMLGEQLRMQG